jgi:hypothetical protein
MGAEAAAEAAADAEAAEGAVADAEAAEGAVVHAEAAEWAAVDAEAAETAVVDAAAEGAEVDADAAAGVCAEAVAEAVVNDSVPGNGREDDERGDSLLAPADSFRILADAAVEALACKSSPTIFLTFYPHIASLYYIIKV